MRRAGSRSRLLLAGLLLAAGTAVADPGIPPARQAELRNLLSQDCGSCHGLTFHGGLGPALTPAALAGKAPAMLREVILSGRPGTPMPPWNSFMNVKEAEWLVQLLLQGTAYER